MRDSSLWTCQAVAAGTKGLPHTLMTAALSLLLLYWAAAQPVLASQPVAQAEAQALLDFKAGITADPQGWLRSWAPASRPCAPPTRWKGVLCDAHNLRVISIDLSARNLSGSISASLALLPALSTLDLSRNLLSGPLPPALFVPHSSLRTLSLGHNSLTGPVPPSIVNLSATLLDLDLLYTGLAGPIPAGIWHLPRLRALGIAGAQLAGSPPEQFAFCSTIRELWLAGFYAAGSAIPASLGGCRKLELLFLDVVGLQGSVPQALWLLPLLQFLVVRDAETKDAIENAYIGTLPADPFKLHGSLPDSFPSCQTIEILVVAGVALNREIPPSLGNCTSLQYLVLSHANLQGAIPATLRNLINLEILHLQSNNLTHGIQPLLSKCSNLVDLRLGDNNLNGSIPATLRNLTNLQVLDLSKNNLRGSMPIQALENCTNLRTLRLHDNELTGKIERFNLSKVEQLQKFTVYQNNFIGGLPAGLTISKSLVLLDVGRNSLSGSFANEHEANIHGLANLRVLVMSYNQLSGKIPGWVWELPSLQFLDLSNNKLKGRMPATLAQLKYFNTSNQSQANTSYTLYEKVPLTLKSTSQILDYVQNTRVFFDVSMNQMEGEIAESFGELLGMTGLNLSHNLIEGGIPSSLANLKHLEALDLAHNNLSGEIPGGLVLLGALASIDLSHNQLRGSIPTANGFNTRFTSASFQGNPRLCGSPLPNCGGSADGHVQRECEPENHWGLWLLSISSIASPWAMLAGYPIGLILGFYLVGLSFRRP